MDIIVHQSKVDTCTCIYHVLYLYTQLALSFMDYGSDQKDLPAA